MMIMRTLPLTLVLTMTALLWTSTVALAQSTAALQPSPKRVSKMQRAVDRTVPTKRLFKKRGGGLAFVGGQRGVAYTGKRALYKVGTKGATLLDEQSGRTKVSSSGEVTITSVGDPKVALPEKVRVISVRALSLGMTGGLGQGALSSDTTKATGAKAGDILLTISVCPSDTKACKAATVKPLVLVLRPSR